jgi:polysaccharide pyruvyl transferase WcaK-like protein
MKKIGLVGYYGHGNFGDELFLYAFRRIFPVTEYRLDLLGRSGGLMRKYRDTRLSRIDKDYGAIIIGGGDLVIPGYDVSNQYFLPEFLEVPVFLHGIGVPTWTGHDEASCKKLKQFLRSPSVRGICARDQESADWINKALMPSVKATCADDLIFSLASTLDFKYERKTPKTIGIVMRSGQNKPGCYMKEFTHQLLAQGYKVKFIMLATGLELEGDLGAVDKLECTGSDQVEIVVRQSDVDLLHAFDGLDAVYSMKFHGCIAALMHGIPTVALITTDKFNNLYRKLGLGNFVIHHTNKRLLESVPTLADFPQLDMGSLYRSSVTAGSALKASIDSLPL